MLFQSLAFLFAAGAIALPIYLHLAKRNTPPPKKFPSLRFIQQSEVATRKKYTPLHILLLLLRCLAIILIALAFARPYFPQPVAASVSKRIVLVDNSYSMRSEGLEETYEALDNLIQSASSEHPIQIGLVGRSVVWMQGYSASPGELRQWLETNQTRYETSDFEPALRQAQQQLRYQGEANREIHIITDGQKLPWEQIRETNFELEPGITLTIHAPDFSSRIRPNVVIQEIDINEERVGETSRYLLEITLQNSSTKSFEGELEIYFSGKRIDALPFSIEPEGFFQTTARFSGKPFQQQHGSVKVVTDDALKADNERFFSINSDKKPIVLSIEPEESDFFESALNLGTQDNRCIYVDLEEAKERELLPQASLIILKRSNFDQSLKSYEGLEETVRNGATLLIHGTGQPEDTDLFQKFGGITGQAEGGSKLLTEIDFTHPLFDLYQRMVTSDLRSIVFHEKIELETQAEDHVIAYMEGSPALVERAFGSGRIINAAFSFDQKSTNWPTQHSFVQFAQSLLGYANRYYSQEVEYRVSNQAVPINGIQYITSLSGDDEAKNVDIFIPRVPGNYRIQTSGEYFLASVNLDPREGKLEPLPETFDYKKWERHSENNEAQENITLSNLDPLPEQDFELPKWLFVLSILILLSDFFIANSTKTKMGTY